MLIFQLNVLQRPLIWVNLFGRSGFNSYLIEQLCINMYVFNVLYYSVLEQIFQTSTTVVLSLPVKWKCMESAINGLHISVPLCFCDIQVKSTTKYSSVECWICDYYTFTFFGEGLIWFKSMKVVFFELYFFLKISIIAVKSKWIHSI